MEQPARQRSQDAKTPLPGSRSAGLDGTPRVPDIANQGQLLLPLAPSLERRRLLLYLMQILTDGVLIYGAFALIGFLYLGDPMARVVLRQSGLMLPVYWTAMIAIRGYSAKALTNVRFSQSRAVLGLLAATGIVLVVLFFAKATVNFSRVTFTFGLAFAAVLLVLSRSLFRKTIAARVGATASNTLVLNDGGEELRIPHAFHVDAKRHGLVPNLHDPHMLDRIGLFMTNMDRVLVSCPPERRADWALVFKGANVQGEIAEPEVLALGALGARRGPDYGTLLVSSGSLGIRARVSKRLFDLGFAAVAVLVLSPLLVVIAIVIKLEDGGPVFFFQQRTGRNNRFFPIMKFRSMRVEKLDAHGTRSASRDDDRITRTGSFIRRTSIDELPQLFNVLRGEMSIVGPRPHAIGSRAGDKKFWEVDRRYWLRHSLKPGLTGLAQIRGLRGATETETDLADRLQADLEYLDGWTIWRDIRIVLATLKVIVHDRAF